MHSVGGRTWAAVLAFGILAATGPAPLQAQDSQTLSVNQFRALGAARLAEGNPADAARVAGALLARNPDDVSAMILGARAAFDGGDPATAAELARRAYWATNDDTALFVAARIAANAHAAQMQDSRAQLWLRRARQYAPTEAASQAIAADYGFLRNRNPWSTSLTFGISPSSNINNGTTSEVLFIGGFPLTFDEEGRGFSGLKYEIGVDTRYRISADNRSALFLDLDADYTTYTLSRDSLDRIDAENARDLSAFQAAELERRALAEALDVPFVPGVPPEPNSYRGSKYAEGTVGIGLTYRRIMQEGMLPLELGVRAAQNWYSGEALSRTYDLTALQSYRIDAENSLTLSALAQERKSLTGDPSTRTYKLTTTWTREMFDSDLLRLSVAAEKAKSDDFRNDFNGRSISVGYDFGTPFNGLQFGALFDLESRDYDASIFGSGPRTDIEATARVSVALTEVEFYGFQPVVSLELRRNRSNVDLYDREYVDLGFDLRSSF